MLWRYRDLRAHVLRSLDLVTPEQAGRRVVYLENRGRADVVAAVGWLYSGLQVMGPGECASSHRHSASALRFIMEGSGAFTNVDRPQDDARRERFRADPQRHLARAWRGRGRHRVHLAGRARHPADERARGQFLRGPSRSQPGDRLSRRRFDRDLERGGPASGGLPMDQALFAAAQIRMGRHLRSAAQLRAGDRRLAVRRRRDGLCEPRHRRAGHADDRRVDADAASGANAPGHTVRPAASSINAPGGPAGR
ncbi:MAG: hypothetical protein WDN24_02425 [Sphingomonas sp.]